METNINLSDVKLVIWDLDDTFWKGTLSEGDITPIKENLELVKGLSDHGIINSINSKNDLDSAEKKLRKLGVRDYFVFLSVNWKSKGQRLKNQINNMNLRPENVLFIDDNHLNIEEAKYYCQGIMTAQPADLEVLYNLVHEADKTDPEHKRLNQYKLLEAKNKEKQQSPSNEAFLCQSEIQVEIHKDCLEQIERIHDLIMRSNQLNYTKQRSTREELAALLNDSAVDSGYVSARDKFGDYGIIGFFACRNSRLLHFVFSCRTLGMGIEQYVYALLNCPEISVNGEVVVQLVKGEQPAWINNDSKSIREQDLKMSNATGEKILLKGPCDMEQLFSYIEDNEFIDSEFTYINNKTGVSIEQHNHTAQIVGSITLDKYQRQLIIEELPFSDGDMFSPEIFTGNYRVVFLSMLTDGNLGVYRRKQTGELIAFGESFYPLTDRNNWKGYIGGEIFNANCTFTYEFLEFFSDQYEFLGRLPVDQIINNLSVIRKNLNSETVLVLILGSETPYLKNHQPSYADRHLVHREINSSVRRWSATNKNVRILDFNDYIKDQGSFFNNINHFIKPIYYGMAKDIMAIVNECSELRLNNQPIHKLITDYAKQRIKKALGRAY